MAVARQSGFCVHHNNCQCVEVVADVFARVAGLNLEAAEVGGEVIVRNSRKEHQAMPPEQRPQVAFTREEWQVFVAGVKDGQFDVP
jgi:hypothetical protein